MTEETLKSAMLLLKAKTTEQYGLMKESMSRPATQGDMETLANMAINLAALEQGLAALQTYGPDLMGAMQHAPVEGTDPTPVVVEEEPDPPAQSEPKRVTPGMSSTLDRVNEIHARQKALKKQQEEQEE